MSKTNDEIFEERVDELVLMEKKISRKVEELTKYNTDMQNKIAAATNKIFESAHSFEAGYNDRLSKIQETVAYSYSEVKLIWRSFTIVALIFGVIIIGAGWRLNYLLRQINIAKDMLAQLDFKLSNTPDVIKWLGSDYIRIAPGSEWDFNKYKSVSEPKRRGTYARVWYSKR